MTKDPAPPLSRQLGRASRRWWLRNGDAVVRVSRPVRRGWAGVAGTLWLLAYTWVGLMLAVGARNLTGADGVGVLVVGVGGGVVMGLWQSRHRMARHLDPATPPLRWFGAALAGWIAVIALVVALDVGAI